MRKIFIKIILPAIGLVVLNGVVCGQSSTSKSPKIGDQAKAALLPRGLSAWSYSYDEGVATKIRSFNSQAKSNLQFKYFFPYAGSLGFNLKKREAKLYYKPTTTSDRYADSLPPGTFIMPIIDARADHKEFSDWTDEQYKAAALKVAAAIIKDSRAIGVQIDIEPFAEAHLPFYKYLRTQLNAHGKYSTMFVGPKNEQLMTKLFEACDILVLSGYDLNGENTGVAKYKKLLGNAVARVQKLASQTQGKYMVGIPAAASWGEYEYAVDKRGGNRIETGVKQDDYVQAALSVLKDYNKSPEFLGISLWQLSKMRATDDADKVTKRTKMPDYIRPSVWTLLENY